MILSEKEYGERLNDIYKLTSILINDFEKENTLTQVLEVACLLLNLENGIISLVKDDKYFFYEFYSSINKDFDKETPIGIKGTFCEETLKLDKLLAISNISESIYKNHPSHIKYGVNCYIGVPVKFNDGERGCIHFTSFKPKKEDFISADIDLVYYLGQWVSHYLDRTFYKQSLSNKHLELEILNKELETKNKDLEDIMKEKNQLLQILVHDLKSPLSNIKMLSYLFQDFSINEETEELLGIFNKSLQYVFHLIEQMETLNSVENFPLNNYIEQFNLNSFLIDTIKSFNSVAEAKSIKLIFDQSPNDDVISTDINFLKRILYNIISNAIKFSPFNKNVFIYLKEVDDIYEISVKDEGPGISEQDQEKLFDKFNKLQNKPTNSESSSGLGLFIVKELLKNIKGDIYVNSKINQGTTFTLKLPKSI